jgi:hypothetical protein
MGEWNEQDYFTKLYTLVSDKDEKFLNELNHHDDIALVGAIKEMISDTYVSDEKKQ